jgi:membrane protein DedA with SNARE-associated domain
MGEAIFPFTFRGNPLDVTATYAASTFHRLVPVGRELGLPRSDPPHGDGKLRHSRAQRDRDPARRIPRRATRIAYDGLGVVLAGTFGSWLGAAITYWVSRWVGRVVVVKFGGFFMISEKKLEMAEHWVHRYEAGGIFFARLLPVVRHLISIPAGIIRMGFGVFSVMTIVGSAAWCCVLAWFGQNVITEPMMSDPVQMVAELKHKSHLIIGGILVLCVLYFIVLKLTAKPAKAGPASS